MRWMATPSLFTLYVTVLTTTPSYSYVWCSGVLNILGNSASILFLRSSVVNGETRQSLATRSCVTAISPSSKSAAIRILGIVDVNSFIFNSRDKINPEGSSDVEFNINTSGLWLLTLAGIASRSVTIATS